MVWVPLVPLRTGSKLGISPLMLAAMNGHTQAAKLLLDHGADINAQVTGAGWEGQGGEQLAYCMGCMQLL